MINKKGESRGELSPTAHGTANKLLPQGQHGNENRSTPLSRNHEIAIVTLRQIKMDTGTIMAGTESTIQYLQ